jgi:hypothetical protein
MLNTYFLVHILEPVVETDQDASFRDDVSESKYENPQLGIVKQALRITEYCRNVSMKRSLFSFIDHSVF